MIEYTNLFVESDSKPPSITDIKNDLDLKFLLDKGLIENYYGKVKTKFVGEVITPNGRYFSLPKRFDDGRKDPSKRITNINIIKDVLDHYASRGGKTFVSNKKFLPSKETSHYISDDYYYKELKEFFLDYITYEFIYPSKKAKKHSNVSIGGAKINILDTIRNRKQYGSGITYDVKDVENDDDWMIDDIYYITLKNLSDEFGSERDKKDISEMYEYLKDEGYKIRESFSEMIKDGVIDNDNDLTIIKGINKSDVGIIHNPIKDILIEYYERRTLKESEYKINVIYTDNFEKVWELLVQDALFNVGKDKFDVGTGIKDKFKPTENRNKWFENKEGMDKFKSELQKSSKVKNIVYKGNFVHYEVENESIPDIFSEHKGEYGLIRFIGDAKYYRDPENAHFEKEFKTYNSLVNNEYPMVVFIPSDYTGVEHVRIDEPFELIIFNISVEDAIKDAIDLKKGTGSGTKTINIVHKLLKNKYVPVSRQIHWVI
jgi:hypothetical protein